MNKYAVKWSDKTKVVKADSATEAIRKVGRQLVFGAHPIFGALSGWYCDADTAGERWSRAWATQADDRIMVEAHLTN